MRVPIFLLLAETAFSQYVLENFSTNPDIGTNARGNKHSCGAAGEITCTFAPGSLTILSNDTDLGFYTDFDKNGCQDISALNNQILHVAFSGSPEFSIALQQNNPECNPNIAPYPETWDIVNAADYVDGAGQNIYIPLAHFDIEKAKTQSVAFKAFRNPNTPTTFTLVDIIEYPLNGIPGFKVPEKKATGPLYFSCTRQNSIAFGIDGGAPELAQPLMEIIKAEKIKVTFFVSGKDLDNPSTNFTNFYKEAIDNGHQVALHSYDPVRVEALNSIPLIDDEIEKSSTSVSKYFGFNSTYFRAPFGTDGALTRQRLEVITEGSAMISWSVDTEDYIWATSETPEKQTDAVARDLDKGGNLFVARFLYQSTVNQFKGFIQMAKKTKKDIMRVDQCLEDPGAPTFVCPGVCVDVAGIDINANINL